LSAATQKNYCSSQRKKSNSSHSRSLPKIKPNCLIKFVIAAKRKIRRGPKKRAHKTKIYNNYSSTKQESYFFFFAAFFFFAILTNPPITQVASVFARISKLPQQKLPHQ
jgi:hypothetical protein